MTAVDIKEFGASTIERAPALEPFLLAMVQQGPPAFIDNAPVEMRILAVDGVSYPLVLATPAGFNTEACSPYAHYIRYTLEELIKRRSNVPPALFKALFWGWSQLARQQWLDKVVYFNNWLLSTNPPLTLSAAQLQAVTGHLKQQYPDRAIVIRSLNAAEDTATVQSLDAIGYQRVPARIVNLIEPVGDRPASWKKNLRADVALLKKSGLRLGDREEVSAHEAGLMADLYRGLYIDKHSAINQQFNTRFFELALSSGFFEFLVLRSGGDMAGMVLEHKHGGRMLAQAIGYDRSLPAKAGVYRQIIAALILSANRQGCTLNLSAGIGEFKQHRGACPVLEWELVYLQHLPVYQRLAWKMVQLQGRAWAGAVQSTNAGAAGAVSDSWEEAGRNPEEAVKQALWRRCSDAVYEPLLRQSLQPASGVLVKTDTWDEANGPGLLQGLGEFADQAIGLDIAASTLRSARRSNPHSPLLQADVRALPLRSGSVSVLVSNSTLDHFRTDKELQASLAELVRVLRPGGQLFITLDNPHNPMVWLRNHLPIGWLLRSRVVPYFVGKTLSSRQLRDALLALGMEVTFSSYSVHAPRVLMVALAAVLERWASPRWQQRLVNVQPHFEVLNKLPSRFLTGHYVVVTARKKR